MKLFDEIYQHIGERKGTNSSFLLAQAPLSACSNSFRGPSLLDVSVGLDHENKEIIVRLMNVRTGADYSNTAQDMMVGKILDVYPNLRID